MLIDPWYEVEPRYSQDPAYGGVRATGSMPGSSDWYKTLSGMDRLLHAEGWDLIDQARGYITQCRSEMNIPTYDPLGHSDEIAKLACPPLKPNSHYVGLSGYDNGDSFTLFWYNPISEVPEDGCELGIQEGVSFFDSVSLLANNGKFAGVYNPASLQMWESAGTDFFGWHSVCIKVEVQNYGWEGDKITLAYGAGNSTSSNSSKTYQSDEVAGYALTLKIMDTFGGGILDDQSVHFIFGTTLGGPTWDQIFFTKHAYDYAITNFSILVWNMRDWQYDSRNGAGTSFMATILPPDGPHYVSGAILFVGTSGATSVFWDPVDAAQLTHKLHWESSYACGILGGFNPVGFWDTHPPVPTPIRRDPTIVCRGLRDYPLVNLAGKPLVEPMYVALAGDPNGPAEVTVRGRLLDCIVLTGPGVGQEGGKLAIGDPSGAVRTWKQVGTSGQLIPGNVSGDLSVSWWTLWTNGLTGTVDVIGKLVVWHSGDKFSSALLFANQIWIQEHPYTIDTVDGDLVLHLTTPIITPGTDLPYHA